MAGAAFRTLLCNFPWQVLYFLRVSASFRVASVALRAMQVLFAWQVQKYFLLFCIILRTVAGVALCATQVFLAWQVQYFFLFCIIARTVAGVALCGTPYSIALLVAGAAFPACAPLVRC